MKGLAILKVLFGFNQVLLMHEYKLIFFACLELLVIKTNLLLHLALHRLLATVVPYN